MARIHGIHRQCQAALHQCQIGAGRIARRIRRRYRDDVRPRIERHIFQPELPSAFHQSGEGLRHAVGIRPLAGHRGRVVIQHAPQCDAVAGDFHAFLRPSHGNHRRRGVAVGVKYVAEIGRRHVARPIHSVDGDVVGSQRQRHVQTNEPVGCMVHVGGIEVLIKHRALVMGDGAVGIRDIKGQAA